MARPEDEQDARAESADLVTVERASTQPIAEMVAGILDGAGISAYVAGSQLQDEWAMSQKLMGLLAVEVQVPLKDVERAREVLRDAKRGLEPGMLIPLGEEGEEGEEWDELELPAVQATEEPEAPAGEGAAGPPPRPRREMWTEVLIVLCLAPVPGLLYSLLDFFAPRPFEKYTVAQDAVYALAYLSSVVVPVLYLMARSGEPARAFGFARPRLVVEVAGGVASLLLGFYLGGSVAYILVQSGFTLRPSGFPGLPGQAPAAVVWTATIVLLAFGEEVVWRGYLLTRLDRLLGSTVASLLITSLLFGAVHLYQGVPGAASAAVVGIILGVVFCLTGRIWGISLAHALLNVIAGLDPRS